MQKFLKDNRDDGMQNFLKNNRDELLRRCTAMVAKRPHRNATKEQLSNGIPQFLDQLIATLMAERGGEDSASLRISGAAGGDAAALSDMGVSAVAHGKSLLALGYTIDQVVHDYGDLCQSITGLAVERDAPFSVDQFRTMNRCLDNAIADAVTGFTFQRDLDRHMEHIAEENARLGFLVHELRNAIGTAKLAVIALERGSLPISGATGSVLKRSLDSLAALVDQSVIELRARSTAPD